MKPTLKVITLGVDDLEASLTFYRDGLGLPTDGIVGTEFEDGAVVFIEMNDGLVLALYPRDALAKDAGVEPGPPSPTELSLGHNVGSAEEVDAVMEEARRAGARIADPACERFWGGYSGYFHDPDGHLWEIAWNPAWSADAETAPDGGQRVTPQLRMTDWSRSRRFYADGLGFRVDWTHTFGPGMPVFAQLSLDGVSIFLTEHAGDCEVGGAAYFVIDDFDGYHDAISANGVEPVDGPVDTEWATREMVVVDPDGNRLRFSTRQSDD